MSSERGVRIAAFVLVLFGVLFCLVGDHVLGPMMREAIEASV